jgi:hypothetical protein
MPVVNIKRTAFATERALVLPMGEDLLSVDRPTRLSEPGEIAGRERTTEEVDGRPR